IGDERRDPEVHRSAFEGIHEDVVPLASLRLLDEDLALARNARPGLLELEQPRDRLQLGLVLAAVEMKLEQLANAFGYFVRERAASAVPARDHGGTGLAGPNVRRHVLDAHELEQVSRENERVALGEAG